MTSGRDASPRRSGRRSWVTRTACAAATAAVLSLGLAPAGTVLGQGAPAAGSKVDEARRLMEKAQVLFQQGKYADAMAEFEAAYQAHPYGAFVYNAALSAEKAGDRQRAIARYKEFLDKNPTAPDAPDIKATIARLEAELTTAPDGGAPAEQTTAPTTATMRSLVVIESEPAGAPLSIWERTQPTAPPFKSEGDNPGWRRVVTGARTPFDVPLGVGHYHVVIDAFQDYRRSETNMNLAPGYVYRFKANLSQGAFLALLRVKTSVEGSRIYVDDPPPHKSAPSGRTSVEALVNSGAHQVWVEAPGHETFTKKVNVEHGDTAQVDATLVRVGYGFLRIDGNTDEIEVEVDGQPHGVYRASGGPLRVQLPAGRHEVEIDASGKKAFEGPVDVPRGQEVGVHATLIDSYGRGKAIAALLGAGGMVVGGYFLTKHADGQADDGEDDTLFRALGTGAFIGAGVLGAASIFLFFYDPNPDSLVKVDKPEEFREEPKTGAAATRRRAGGAGVMVRGAF